MTDNLKDFILENTDLINQNTKEAWEEIYDMLVNVESLRYITGEFTKVILDANINDPAEIMGYIPKMYFCGYHGNANYKIPESIKSIEEYAFLGYDYFRILEIPSNVKKIGRSAFCECCFLTTLTISDSVEIIEPYAFGDCYNLTRVTIGNNLKTIGEGAFYKCPNLKYITINSAFLTFIGENIFENCPKLKEIHYNGPMKPELLKLKGRRKTLKIICTDGEIEL